MEDEQYGITSRHTYTCEIMRFQTAQDAEHPYSITATITKEDGKPEIQMTLQYGAVRDWKHNVAHRKVHSMNAMCKRIAEWEKDFDLKFYPYTD